LVTDTCHYDAFWRRTEASQASVEAGGLLDTTGAFVDATPVEAVARSRRVNAAWTTAAATAKRPRVTTTLTIRCGVLGMRS
jgi:hypothetical protein